MSFQKQQTLIIKIGLLLIPLGMLVSIVIWVVALRLDAELAFDTTFFVFTMPAAIGVLTVLVGILRGVHRPRVLERLSPFQLKKMINSQSGFFRLTNGFWRWYLHVEADGLDKEAAVL